MPRLRFQIWQTVVAVFPWTAVALVLFAATSSQAQQGLFEAEPLRNGLVDDFAGTRQAPTDPRYDVPLYEEQIPYDAGQLPDNGVFPQNGPENLGYGDPVPENGRYEAHSRRRPAYEGYGTDPFYGGDPYGERFDYGPDFRYETYGPPQTEWGYQDPRPLAEPYYDPQYRDERPFIQDDVYADPYTDPGYPVPQDFVPTEEWQRKVPVFRIGVVTGANYEQKLRKIVPLRHHLLRRLRILVEFVSLNDLNDVIRALDAKRIDYVAMSASAYAQSWIRCECVEPLVVPKAEDGTDGFYSVLIARADSDVSDLNSMKDTRLALLSPRSTTGFQLPMAMFEEADIVAHDHFKLIGAARTAAIGLRAVQAGDYDIAATWSTLSGDAGAGYSRGPLRDLVANGDLSMDHMKVVWQSKKIPHGPHVIRKTLPEELKQRLLTLMLELETENPTAYEAAEPRFSGGFAKAAHDDFAPLLALADKRGNKSASRSSLVVIGGE